MVIIVSYLIYCLLFYYIFVNVAEPVGIGINLWLEKP
jgi:hypothetical protein